MVALCVALASKSLSFLRISLRQCLRCPEGNRDRQGFLGLTAVHFHQSRRGYDRSCNRFRIFPSDVHQQECSMFVFLSMVLSNRFPAHETPERTRVRAGFA
jgi:hypothetical protein